MFLAIASFLLVLYAAFLTRSGVLGDFSVHSFADVGLLWYLVGFMAFFAIVGLGLLIWRAGEAGSRSWYGKLASKEFAFFVALIGLSMLALLILIGTSSPIITKALGYTPSSVKTSYYGKVSSPIAIVLLAAVALAPLLSWARRATSDERPSGVRLRAAAGAVVLCILCALIAYGIAGPGPAVQVAVGSLAGVALLVNLLHVARLVRGSWRMLGGYLAHVGIALMFIGMVFSPSVPKPTRLILPEGGRSVAKLGYDFTFLGVVESPAKDRAALRIRVERNGKSFTATPEFRPGQRGETMGVPHIHRSITQDLYIAPAALRSLELEPSVEITARSAERAVAETPDGRLGVQLMAVGPNREAFLLVRQAGGKPAALAIARGKAARVGPYTLTFKGFNMQGGHEQAGVMKMSALLEVDYPGAVQSAVVDVTENRLISLLWLGSILALLGGVIALIRRAGENRRIAAAGREPDEAEELAYAAGTV